MLHLESAKTGAHTRLKNTTQSSLFTKHQHGKTLESCGSQTQTSDWRWRADKHGLRAFRQAVLGSKPCLNITEEKGLRCSEMKDKCLGGKHL